MYAIAILPNSQATYRGISTLLGIGERSTKRVVHNAVAVNLVEVRLPKKLGPKSKTIIKLTLRARLMLVNLFKEGDFYEQAS